VTSEIGIKRHRRRCGREIRLGGTGEAFRPIGGTTTWVEVPLAELGLGNCEWGCSCAGRHSQDCCRRRNGRRARRFGRDQLRAGPVGPDGPAVGHPAERGVPAIVPLVWLILRR
jgi:hypothetical protein